MDKLSGIMKRKNSKTAFTINGHSIRWTFIWMLKRKRKLDAYLIDRIFFIVAQETKGDPIPYIVGGLNQGWLIQKAMNAPDKYDPRFIDRWIQANIYK